MYLNDGAFGKVRFAHYVPPAEINTLFLPSVCGWHKCNDLYSINRYGNGFDKHLLLITISGMGSMTINSTEYPLPAGSIALLPRNTDVSYCTPKGGLWEFYWIHPSATCIPFLDEIVKIGNFTAAFDTSHNYSERVEKLIKLSNESFSGVELEISLEMSTILHFCAMDLNRKLTSTSLPEKACSYITKNFKEQISLKHLADELYVSTAHLIRSFKKEYGCTPHQYLLSYRLSCSVELLKFGNMQIEEIASAIGFSSSSHFISAFRKKYGCTPKQFSA